MDARWCSVIHYRSGNPQEIASQSFATVWDSSAPNCLHTVKGSRGWKVTMQTCRLTLLKLVSHDNEVQPVT